MEKVIKKALCLIGVLSCCPFLNSSSDLDKTLRIPEDSISQIRKEFENLNRMYPVDEQGRLLNYNDGREYKVKRSIEFVKRLDSLVPDDDARGYLILQLFCVYFGAGGYGNALEKKGLECFFGNIKQSVIQRTRTVESLLRLSVVLKKFDDEQKTDPYGFCGNTIYYSRMLRDEVQGLNDELKSCPQNFTEGVVAARQTRKKALKFLKSMNKTSKQV